MKSRFESARKWLILGTLFIGIGAVGGAACMLAAPDGSQHTLRCTGRGCGVCAAGRGGIMNKRILIIDDDVSIGNLVEEVLNGAGYDTLRAYSGTEALLLLKTQRPDLILLDLMLPGLSGEELLPQLSQFPVIVLSAKADVADKVSLLLGGAVDYLTKPFDTSELLARIAVQLRQRPGLSSAPVYTHGGLTLDTAARAVTVDGVPVALTKTEYAILKLLIQRPNQVFAKPVILEQIAADTPDCTESSLKTHMSHLRGKLRQAGAREYIESVWGIGFKMAAP